jgi:hypothetical protein
METVSAGEEGGACGVLISEHRRIEDHVRRFREAEGARRRKAEGDECLGAVELVLALEEQLFFPAARRILGERRAETRVQAAGRAARLRIAELRGLPAGEAYDARFIELAEGLSRHFAEERAAILPRAIGSSLDAERLGGEMTEFRARFLRARSGGLGRRCLRTVAALF